MSDSTSRPGRPAPGWTPAFLIISAIFAGSLALPWTEEWTQQHYRGWDVLFAGDEYPPLGVLVVAAWVTAAATAISRPSRGPAAYIAVIAATTVCGVCPGYYGWEITRDRGSAIGEDAAGRISEWVITATPDIGFSVASLSATALLVGVVLRIRQARQTA